MLHDEDRVLTEDLSASADEAGGSPTTPRALSGPPSDSPPGGGVPRPVTDFYAKCQRTRCDGCETTPCATCAGNAADLLILAAIFPNAQPTEGEVLSAVGILRAAVPEWRRRPRVTRWIPGTKDAVAWLSGATEAAQAACKADDVQAVFRRRLLTAYADALLPNMAGSNAEQRAQRNSLRKAEAQAVARFGPRVAPWHPFNKPGEAGTQFRQAYGQDGRNWPRETFESRYRYSGSVAFPISLDAVYQVDGESAPLIEAVSDREVVPTELLALDSIKTKLRQQEAAAVLAGLSPDELETLRAYAERNGKPLGADMRDRGRRLRVKLGQPITDSFSGHWAAAEQAWNQAVSDASRVTRPGSLLVDSGSLRGGQPAPWLFDFTKPLRASDVDAVIRKQREAYARAHRRWGLLIEGQEPETITEALQNSTHEIPDFAPGEVEEQNMTTAQADVAYMTKDDARKIELQLARIEHMQRHLMRTAFGILVTPPAKLT